jgi:hypothetical protein
VRDDASNSPRHSAACVHGLRAELSPDGAEVVVHVAAKTSASSGIQVGRLDHDQAHPMGRDALVTTSVIQSPLLSPMDSAHGLARAAVLERLFVGWPGRVVVAQQEAPDLLVSNTRDVLVEEGGCARVVGVVV